MAAQNPATSRDCTVRSEGTSDKIQWEQCLRAGEVDKQLGGGALPTSQAGLCDFHWDVGINLPLKVEASIPLAIGLLHACTEGHPGPCRRR